jgi:hypothetical protein
VLSDWYPDQQPPSAVNAMQRHNFLVKLDAVMDAVHQALESVRISGATAANGAQNPR